MQKFGEAFKGDLEFAYHRTRASAVPSIVKNGFRPGSGDMYGKGWYMCYDLESQLRSVMTGYGDAVIKCQIFDKGVLILDYNISKKMYGNKYTLVDQLLREGIFRTTTDIPQFYKDMSVACEGSLTKKEISAEVAYQCFVQGQDPKLYFAGRSPRSYRWGEGTSCLNANGVPKLKKITAIVFSGNHDGNVIVGYSPNTVQPLSYAIIDDSVCYDYASGKITKADVDAMFVKLDDYEIAEQRSANARALYERLGAMRNSSIVSLSILCEMSEAEFDKKFRWIDRESKVTDAEVEVDKNGKFRFLGGSWDQGTWLGDEFGEEGLNSSVQPIFRSGVFAKGNFYGVWEYGRFTGGSFKGTWRGRGRGNLSGGIWAAPASCWDATKADVSPGATFTYEVRPGKFVDSELTPDQFLTQNNKPNGPQYDVSPDGKTLFSLVDKKFAGACIIQPGIETVDAGAFAGSAIKSVQLPDSVKKIGASAFNGCSSLEKVVLPKQLQTIEADTFAFTGKLMGIVIPPNVKLIESSAFSNSGLLAVDIPDSVKVLGNSAFANSNVGRIKFPKGLGEVPENVAIGCERLFSLELPQNCYVIRETAFQSCKKLKKIILPKTLETIEKAAFYNSGLTELVIPEKVETISEEAFGFNGSLTKVTLPKSLKSVGAKAFKYCSSALEVIYNGTQQDWMHIDFNMIADDVFDAGVVVRCKDGDITIGA